MTVAPRMVSGLVRVPGYLRCSACLSSSLHSRSCHVLVSTPQACADLTHKVSRSVVLPPPSSPLAYPPDPPDSLPQVPLLARIDPGEGIRRLQTRLAKDMRRPQEARKRKGRFPRYACSAAWLASQRQGPQKLVGLLGVCRWGGIPRARLFRGSGRGFDMVA